MKTKWNETNMKGVFFVGDVSDIPDALMIPQPTAQELMSDAVTLRIHNYLHKDGNYQSHQGHEKLKRWRACEHGAIQTSDYLDIIMGSEGLEERETVIHTCLDCGFSYKDGEG